MLTQRLELRRPAESDRARFVELFCDEAFMAFTAGPNDKVHANERFDRMLAGARDIEFAKQPVIERETRTIVGYSGVAQFELEGETCLEFGYRLCTEARGKGYATEAGLALLDLARRRAGAASPPPEIIYAMIHPTNEPSVSVIGKLGFTFWKLTEIDGVPTNFYRMELS